MDIVDGPLSTSRVEYCSVCGDQADGYHYGVLSCRGCNAFFRRAITYNLEFQCLRGGNCIINRNARCACRACRLEKCKIVGMDRSAVQVTQEKNGCGGKASTVERRTDHDRMITVLPLASPADSFASHQSVSPSSGLRGDGVECVGSPGSAFTLVGASRASLSPNVWLNGRCAAIASSFTAPIHIFGSASAIASMPSTFLISPSVDRPDNATTYFARLTDEYFDQRRRRRSMLCVTLEDILSENTDLDTIYRVQMILMFEWMEKLPEFQQLANAHDKVRLLRSFSLKYFALDNVVYTLENSQLERLLLVNNNFVQPHLLPTAVRDCTTLEQQRAYSLLYGENVTKTVDELLKPMTEMNITFAEFMFLRLLLLWNPGPIGLTPQAEDLVQKASEQAHQQLHLHLESDFNIDLKGRLGALLLFLSPLTKHTQTIAEITTLIPNFGALPEWDSFMNDLLRN